MARKSPLGAPTMSTCYFGISSALIFAWKTRSKSVTHPFPCSVGVGEWPVIFGQVASRNVPAQSDTLSLASQHSPLTHPLTLYLFKPPENRSGEKKKKKIIQESIAKAKQFWPEILQSPERPMVRTASEDARCLSMAYLIEAEPPRPSHTAALPQPGRVWSTKWPPT